MILSKECIACEKVFYNNPDCQTTNSRTWIERKYCSITCANKFLHKKPQIDRECFYCKKHFLKSPSQKAKYCSNECKYKNMSISSKGSNNHQWKGEKAGYHALHRRVYTALGKADHCSFDKSHKHWRFEWANISHEYHHELSDWMPLCPSCHRIYDLNAKSRHLFINN